MSGRALEEHSFVFWGNNIHGLNTASFNVVVFTVDNVSVSGYVTTSLDVSEISTTGFYVVSYTPDSPGSYILAIQNVVNSIYAAELVDVGEASTIVKLSQDYPTPGALKPSGQDFSRYTLLVFNSRDWEIGRSDAKFAVAQTGLDASGNWLITPLPVLHGTYHVAVRNLDGTTICIWSYLVV